MVNRLMHFHKNIQKYDKVNNRSFFLITAMLLFFVLFDGIMGYITPLAIIDAGISQSMMGIIIGFSSVAGMIFDLILCRLLNNTNYRRLLIIMFVIAFFFPVLTLISKTIWLFLLAVAIWGLYYDLLNLSNYNFIANNFSESEHVKYFGIIAAFKNVGYLLAPIIAGIIIVDRFDYKPVFAAVFFLAIAFSLFIIHFFQTKNNSSPVKILPQAKPVALLLEIKIWKKLGFIIFGPLLLMVLIHIIDAFFWTLIPLLEEKDGIAQGKGSYLLACYNLAPLLVSRYVEPVTQRFHKKKTALFLLTVAGILLIAYWFIDNFYLLLVINFVASIIIAICYPVLNAIFSGYIKQAPNIEREIETLLDWFINLGYVIGPIMAGFLGQYYGFKGAFSILGGLTVVLTTLTFILLLQNKKITSLDNISGM